MRSLSRRQVAHHSPRAACVTTLRSWPVPRRHPCRAFARRCQPAPGRSDRLRFPGAAGRAAAAVSRSLHGLHRPRPSRLATGPRRTSPFGTSPRCPTPTAGGTRVRTLSNIWSAIRSEAGRPSKAERSRDRSSAHAAAVMASQVTLAASTPRSASAGSTGVLMVLDPRLELGVVSGAVLGDLDPALPGVPLTLTRGTRRPQQHLLKVTDWGAGAYGSAIAAPSAWSCHEPTPARGDASVKHRGESGNKGCEAATSTPYFVPMHNFCQGAPAACQRHYPETAPDPSGDGCRRERLSS